MYLTRKKIVKFRDVFLGALKWASIVFLLSSNFLVGNISKQIISIVKLLVNSFITGNFSIWIILKEMSR